MSEQSALQDLLAFAVKGVGYWADMARLVGAKDDEVDKYVMSALAAIDKADANTLSALSAKAPAFQKQAKEVFEKKNGRAFSGFLPAAGKPLQIPEDRAEQVSMGGQIAKDRVSKDIAAARQEIFSTLKKVAAKGNGTDAVCVVVGQGIAAILNDKLEKEEYDEYGKKLAAFVK
jgi:hydroxylamine reductase